MRVKFLNICTRFKKTLKFYSVNKYFVFFLPRGCEEVENFYFAKTWKYDTSNKTALFSSKSYNFVLLVTYDRRGWKNESHGIPSLETLEKKLKIKIEIFGLSTILTLSICTRRSRKKIFLEKSNGKIDLRRCFTSRNIFIPKDGKETWESGTFFVRQMKHFIKLDINLKIIYILTFQRFSNPVPIHYPVQMHLSLLSSRNLVSADQMLISLE